MSQLETLEFMTEEDERFVAEAVLAGVRFWKMPGQEDLGLWTCDYHTQTLIAKFSLPRCAEYVLWKMGHRTDAEHLDYDIRSDMAHTRNPDLRKLDVA